MARTFTAAGVQRLVTPATSRYDIRGAFSCAFRLYLTAQSGGHTMPLTFTDNVISNQGTQGWMVRIDLDGTRIHFMSLFNDFTKTDIFSNSNLSLSLWYHIVCRSTNLSDVNQTIDYFVNGLSDLGVSPTVGTGTKVGVCTQPLGIGNGCNASPAYGIAGSMESVGIWNRLITAGEALALANGVPPTEFRVGLVSHYELGSWGGPVKDTESGLVAFQEGGVPFLASVWPSRPPEYNRVRARYATPIPYVRPQQNQTLQAVNRAATF